jgi:NADH-quinone oxidoreductase subunit E
LERSTGERTCAAHDPRECFTCHAGWRGARHTGRNAARGAGDDGGSAVAGLRSRHEGVRARSRQVPARAEGIGGDRLPRDRAARTRLGFDESEAFVAKYLGMPEIAVHEVTTFYNMFNQHPVGRFKLNVCTNLPCQLREGQVALEHLCTRLGVEEGGTTADGLFTVQKAECLGACADAPVMLVNDRQMCSFMTPERLDELVAMLASHAVIERAA